MFTHMYRYGGGAGVWPLLSNLKDSKLQRSAEAVPDTLLRQIVLPGSSLVPSGDGSCG